jgi:glycosyltransferase involved in cell wall biosynthesis
MAPGDPGDDSVKDLIVDDFPYSANLLVVNADNMTSTTGRMGAEAVRDRFNIAMWIWELADFPDDWCKEMLVIDEFWASSSFVQQSIGAKAHVPVVWMPEAVTIADAEPGYGRSAFGIPEYCFTFLFQFDFTGFIERKNPLAVVRAFRQAFPAHSASGPVLVIKTNHAEAYPEKMRLLEEEVARDPNVVIVNGTFRKPRVMALMQACDVFVSLHRTEGFGRSLAEAMLMGKPVIATNYSGNTDFTRQDNACPVNYSLVPVLEGQYPYPEGQVWAEADIDHAAWYMRRLATNRILREQLGRAARATIVDRYSLEATGRRMADRLRLLRLVE